MIKYRLPIIIVVAVALFIITFPSIEPEFGVGLDTSYVWAFNHLFDQHKDILPQLIYPIGPLGFLRMPLTFGNNLLYSILFLAIIKLLFLGRYMLHSLRTNSKQLWILLPLIVVSLFSTIDYLLIGVTTLFAFSFIREPKIQYLTIALLVAFIGLCIKISIGICAGSIIGMALIIAFYHENNYKNIAAAFLYSLIAVFILALLVFEGPLLAFHYFVHSLQFSFGFSNALSLKGSYHGYELLIFASLFVVAVLVIRNKQFRIAWLLLLPALFAAWKHGLSRQDISHGTQFFYFLILYWVLLIGFADKKKFLVIVFAVFNLYGFYCQLASVQGFQGLTVNTQGLKNFNATILHYADYKKQFNDKSLANIAAAGLDKSTLEIIGNKSIDSYPWELSYFAASSVNWKPRRTLQSGSFAHWLDTINAEDFNASNGPDYLLLHYIYDQQGSDMASIDGRYLLNENPLTLLEIFSNYSLREKTSRYLLYEKKKTPLALISKFQSEKTVYLNDWINVPQGSTTLTRIRLKLPSSFVQQLRAFVYQPAIYSIDYRFANDRVLSYAFNPDNARDGLWINPFVVVAASSIEEVPVAAIRIRCNNQNSQQAFTTQLEEIYFRESSKQVVQSPQTFFGKNIDQSSALVLDTLFLAHESRNAQVLAKDGYSTTLRLSLDSLWIISNSEELLLEATAEFVTPVAGGSLVMAVDESETKEYRGIALTNESGFATSILRLSKATHEHGKLIVYVWNDSKENISVHQLRLRILKESN